MNNENLEGEFEFYSAIITIQETFKEIYEIMGADIGAIGRNITSVIDATKKLTDIAIKTQNLELQESVLELRSQLVDIKTSLVEVREENFELREENKNLKEQLTKPTEKLKLTRRSDSFWYSTASDIDPVCSACFDSTDKIIRLTATNLMVRQAMGSNYMCPVCKQTY